MRSNRCKGTRDISPEEMAAFRLIEGQFRDCCLKSGYREVRTPTIEYLHLFTSAGTLTPGMIGRVYSFLDWDGWSGERVVLRPDGTIPVARLYIDCLADSGLARLFYVTNIFIFDDSGSRERWQCGAELIGAGSPVADAELISLSLEMLNGLQLDAKVRLAHVGLIKGLLSSLEISPQEQAATLDQVLDGDASALTRALAARPDIGNALLPLLTLKGQSSGFLKNLKALVASDLPALVAPLDDFISVVSLLDMMGCRYEIDLASAAGFEYYTGVTFQLFAGGEKVGGGGRYDALIPLMGGGDVPACGFALYADRLMSLKERPSRTAPLVLVRAKSGELLKDAFGAARRLREAGFIAELELRPEQPAGNWLLDMQDTSPRFALSRRGTERFEAGSIDDVLTLLEDSGAGKNSPA
ncbi:MAG: histidine--tRNA ligase family protein [Chloroflexi bacterium]|nr:histidine--tRNA ligase family protein [Chloroflexota bacterium]